LPSVTCCIVTLTERITPRRFSCSSSSASACITSSKLTIALSALLATRLTTPSMSAGSSLGIAPPGGNGWPFTPLVIDTILSPRKPLLSIVTTLSVLMRPASLATTLTTT